MSAWPESGTSIDATQGLRDEQRGRRAAVRRALSGASCLRGGQSFLREQRDRIEPRNESTAEAKLPQNGDEGKVRRLKMRRSSIAAACATAMQPIGEKIREHDELGDDHDLFTSAGEALMPKGVHDGVERHEADQPDVERTSGGHKGVVEQDHPASERTDGAVGAATDMSEHLSRSWEGPAPSGAYEFAENSGDHGDEVGRGRDHARRLRVDATEDGEGRDGHHESRDR
ncbi:hypothetical protein FQA39_LY19395 [Lamprigera yunnana]|nr:hypothetical protein FQA39_LY19395 [Lamprigera yunnana]